MIKSHGTALFIGFPEIPLAELNEKVRGLPEGKRRWRFRTGMPAFCFVRDEKGVRQFALAKDLSLVVECSRVVTSSGRPKDRAIVKNILAELDRAMSKYPTWPNDPLHALAVLGEEYGELTKAMLQLTYEPHKTSLDEVRSEAIQTAAMAIRLALSLPVYYYSPSHQHNQEAVL